MTIEAPERPVIKLRDALPVPFETLPIILKKAITLAEEQHNLDTDDQKSVTAISAWTINPKGKRLYLTSLGISESFIEVFDKVANNPLLEKVCEEISNLLDKQLSPRF